MENEKCYSCDTIVTERVKKYSKDKFGKVLCFKCQQQQQEKENINSTTSKTKPDLVSRENIITLQGKEYITHAGLLEAAHAKGIKSILTEIISGVNMTGTVIVKAKVKMKDDSVFIAHGDANEKNTNRNIALHKIRMAETRAVNRALRFATNIGMCSIEELGENNGSKTSSQD